MFYLLQEAVGDTLEELWISHNNIEKLKGINVLKKLKVSYLIMYWHFCMLSPRVMVQKICTLTVIEKKKKTVFFFFFRFKSCCYVPTRKKGRKRVSDCCSAPSELYFSYIMEMIRGILMRWYPLCGICYSDRWLKQQSGGGVGGWVYSTVPIHPSMSFRWKIIEYCNLSTSIYLHTQTKNLWHIFFFMKEMIINKFCCIFVFCLD